MEQLSLFSGSRGTAVARRLMDGREVEVSQPEDWMLELQPNGVYACNVAGHDCALYPAKITEAQVDVGLRYCYYLIDGALFGSVFAGKEIQMSLEEETE